MSSKRTYYTIFAGVVLLVSLVFYANSNTSPQLRPDSIGSADMVPAHMSTTTDGWHTVVRDIDGDTIVVSINGKDTTIRLIGVDTPETVDPTKPVECFGQQASAEAKKVLDGTVVRLQTDPTQTTLDKYGRTLAYVFEADGTDFDEFMVAQGYGREYTYDKPYEYQKEFKAAQTQAQAQKLGLWGACAQ